jgi:ribosomal protein uL23
MKEIKVRKTRTKVEKEKKKEGKLEKRKIERKEKTAKKKEEKELKKTEMKGEISDSFNTLRFVLMTERAIQIIEAQNKLVFIVNRKAGKEDIKKAVENAFNTQVSRVQTSIDQQARKKAYVKFKKPGEAGEIAIRLGII